MAGKNEVAVVSLRRTDTSQPWGFRMKGGVQEGMPLFVEGVARNGRAANAGLRAGDVIVMICDVNVQRYTHDQAKAEMLRAGNDLDITVIKGAMPRPRGVNSPAMASPLPNSPSPMMSNSPVPVQRPEERVQVVEEPLGKLGGPTYKDVTPKTYQVLKEELPAAEHGAGRPASIFDRKREERSQYLHAAGPTIQKAYGQTH